MRIADYELDTPRMLLVGFALIVVGAFVFASATSVVAFGAFNPSWEGTTDVRSIASQEGAETDVVTNTTQYTGYGNETVAVVLAPDEPYDEADVRRIEAFLARGGTLLVADRDGTGNELLEAIGADARVDGALLRDERNYYRDPALPEANQVTDHPLTEDVDGLTLNYGTVVEPGGSTVLIESSEFAYLDRNGNGELDDSETLDSYPVATTESVDDGRVVVVSDPSAFINVMAERTGNRRFARNLFATGETVLVDTSHSGEVPPLVAVVLAVRGSPLLQSGIVGFGLLVLFGWQTNLFAREESRTIARGPSAETLAESAAERYPGFDRSRLRRLMKGIKSINPERGDDE